jgi:RNA polymerase sigma factor (sigma-70 family)
MEAGALHAPAGLSRISIGTPLLRLRSDEQLVAAFRAGSEEAFQVIFDRYRQRLFAYTRQMLSGSRQDAEDALQDVFLRAYAALRANDRPVSLRAWLYRVAHNRCIDQLRRPTPAQADVFDLSRSPLRDPILESQRREDLRRLVEDVQRLPEAQRSALLMREMDGLSYQELADALDVTVPAIKSLLVRARIGLVEAVEARDTACVEIRNDLMSSYDRGVRASGKARRHLRDCAPCREYRTDLRSVQRGLGALSPGDSGPLGLLAKLFGLGGGAGGAAAGGGAVLGGGGAAVAGGGVASVTACKVAALVCSAAFVTGAAGNIERAVKQAVVSPPVARTHAASSSASAAAGASAGTSSAHVALSHAPLRRLEVSTAVATTATAATASTAALTTHRARHNAQDVDASASVAALRDDEQPMTPDDEVYATPEATTAHGTATSTNLTGGAAAPSATSAPATAVTPAPAGSTPADAADPTAAAGTPGSASTGTGTTTATGATGSGTTTAAPGTTTGTPATATAPAASSSGTTAAGTTSASTSTSVAAGGSTPAPTAPTAG